MALAPGLRLLRDNARRPEFAVTDLPDSGTGSVSVLADVSLLYPLFANLLMVEHSYDIGPNVSTLPRADLQPFLVLRRFVGPGTARWW